ncbi:hypothetical protein CEE36_10910 [candidate division TA06 bacterium B3_TA06]|uniref:Uncharacterized protein n=1 Tax=candidate division TA06 bacterium B3_TA06 TaxID=2012487 RepID=A0A532USI3_UNCT6|nr:MAG: hypothetical protein CEE36_10910 [candidate division TA06 bacterium B3_TA06]
MKKMRLSFSLLVIGLVLIGVLGCKKERWLRVYNNGVFEDSINVTGWEVNEDVVWLDYFYYPWQGEDSIDFREGLHYFEDETGFDKHPFFVLEANGKIVGFRSDYAEVITIPDSNLILTITYPNRAYTLRYKDFSLDDLKRFPNLVGVYLSIDSRTGLSKLESIPRRIRLYLHCYTTDDALKKLSNYQNIRTLLIEGDYSHRGVRYLLRLKNLKLLTTKGVNINDIPGLKRLSKLWVQ